MTVEFIGVSHAEALKRAEDADVWVIDQMISSHTTLLYGEAKVGKSFLVSALIASLATGSDFLGRQVPPGRSFDVAVCWTDDNGEGEYSGRIQSVLAEGEQPNVKYYQLPIMQNSGHWDALFDAVMANGHDFVVIDNLAQCLDGSVNDDAVVRRFFDGVRRFTRAGIPVVVVAHSSDKAGANGFKPETPLGSAYISQAVRWRVFVRRSKRGNLTLKFMGNHAEPYEMTLHHGAGARFDVLDTKTAEALKAKAEGDSRARDKRTLDRNLDVAKWMVDHCQGMSKREAADAYAEKHNQNTNTVRSWVTRGSVPVTVDNGVWQLTETAQAFG